MGGTKLRINALCNSYEIRNQRSSLIQREVMPTSPFHRLRFVTKAVSTAFTERNRAKNRICIKARKTKWTEMTSKEAEKVANIEARALVSKITSLKAVTS